MPHPMRKKLPEPGQIEELHRVEEQLSLNPTVDGCLELADRYAELGMAKDAQRLIQVAELLEKDSVQTGNTTSDSLLSGSINPLMIIEVLQILARTRKSGELVLESTGQTFRIFFDRGQIINAHSTSEMPGITSFLMAIRIAEGTYRFRENNEIQIERLIEDKTDHLIMEAARLMDESTGESAART